SADDAAWLADPSAAERERRGADGVPASGAAWRVASSVCPGESVRRGVSVCRGEPVCPGGSTA
ncbi:hypothetical protein NGM37_49320, partial [Streptomyces sp. TRM76130]|nr:hypothetical protein [Streptomyces sp. TRM76130]